MKRSAILIIDMLNDFFIDERLKTRRKGLCEAINNLTSWGRKKGIKVIWVRQQFKSDLSDAFLSMQKKRIYKTIENTDGAMILAELDRKKEDIEIIKKRYSAFYKTNLPEILEKEGIRQLIICGINTHACIRTAAIDAFQRDLDVIIARDCVDSYDQEHHEISLKYLGNDIAIVTSSVELINMNASLATNPKPMNKGIKKK